MEFLRFNLHGNVIEFCKDTSQWSWSGWIMDKEELFFCNGNVEFKKIVDKKDGTPLDSGETIICLVPGEMVRDPRFHSVQDAIEYHSVDQIGNWGATKYWVGYNDSHGETSFYVSDTGDSVEFCQASGGLSHETVSEMRKILDVMLPLYESGVDNSVAVATSPMHPQLNGAGQRSAELIWN